MNLFRNMTFLCSFLVSQEELSKIPRKLSTDIVSFYVALSPASLTCICRRFQLAIPPCGPPSLPQAANLSRGTQAPPIPRPPAVPPTETLNWRVYSLYSCWYRIPQLQEQFLLYHIIPNTTTLPFSRRATIHPATLSVILI